MCFASDENSDSLSEGSLKLLVKLVDANSIYEVMNILIIWFTSENHSNIKSNEDIVISWACSDWEFIGDVLLGNKELDLGPWEAENETTFLLDVVEFTVLGDDCIGSFWYIDVWGT